jgi:hypothetical protein
MERFIEVFAVLAVFAMVHERVLEVLRSPLDKFFPTQEARATSSVARVLDAATAGSFNWVSGVVLALLTHADLLTLIRENAAEFFNLYLKADWRNLGPKINAWHHILGCVLMGLTTTVGSKFWHDALNGLMDVRGRLKGLQAEAKKLGGFELKQALDTAATHLQENAKAKGKEDILVPVVEALQAASKGVEVSPPK